MQRPRLLWVRITEECTTRTPRKIAAEYFELEVCDGIEAAHAALARFAPQVVCCDFEHPHADELRAMRDFKRLHPSLPLLMLTTQHSEGLAIWAFRVRVWNYLLKPASASELRANFDVLARLVSENQGPPRKARCVGTMMPEDVPESSNPPAATLLDAALKQVEQHHGEKLRQSAVAAACGMSVCAFSRAFKGHYGLTFRDYLLRYRIGRACELLRQGLHGATEAGQAVGFDDASHFARAFRRVLGTSPSSYQRRLNGLPSYPSIGSAAAPDNYSRLNGSQMVLRYRESRG